MLIKAEKDYLEWELKQIDTQGNGKVWANAQSGLTPANLGQEQKDKISKGQNSKISVALIKKIKEFTILEKSI